MALLKNRQSTLLILAALQACGPTQTATIIQDIESDTTIQSDSSTPLAASENLSIEQSSARESRILLKIPTEAPPSSKSEEEEFFKDLDLLETIGAIVVFPIYLTVKAISQIFGCQEDVVSSTYLTSAAIVLTPRENYGALANTLESQTLSQAWWSTSTWKRSHSFSKKGLWQNQGADVDSSFTPIPSVDSSSPEPNVRFDITNYFKSIMDSTDKKKAHYGMRIRSTLGSQTPIKFYSSQSNVGTRPYVISTYTGPCTPLSQTPSSYNTEPQTRVFLLRQN